MSEQSLLLSAPVPVRDNCVLILRLCRRALLVWCVCAGVSVCAVCLGSAHVEVKFLQFELSARRYRGSSRNSRRRRQQQEGWGQGTGRATGAGA